MNAELLEKKKKIVEYYLKQKKLLSKELLQQLQQEEHVEHIYKSLHTIPSQYTVSITQEYEFEKENYAVQDFTQHFITRFRALENMLKGRQELKGLTSIRRAAQKSERETVSLIGMVYEKSLTKNGNIILVLEDLSGFIKVIISTNSPCFAEAQDTMLDEVIGIVGSAGNNVVFANSLIVPDVPLATEIKKSPDEAYAVVAADPQVGSKLFIEQQFNNFIEWTRGNYGTTQEREIAAKTGYILIPGDVIEGVGIFPRQEEELDITDVYEQYKTLATYLARIPRDKHIIICTGNHDACRIAEPQPRIYKDLAPDLYALPNCHLVTNPSIVTIHKHRDFAGFTILFYHGFSYSYYCDQVQSIKDSGLPISDRTGIIMKYLLRRRHLAPSYGSTRAVPNPAQDCLVIQQVPDFFISGHIHKAVVTNYRGVNIICGSCFQSGSAYQEKFGHIPVPGQVPLINLKTRKVSMLEF
ncbi:hypothetical protein GF342_01620 [Candidatus Woesearchaeota archaeon]|nr:hypothetical protein [Candidatus Woesearchaeota archaeon]